MAVVGDVAVLAGVVVDDLLVDGERHVLRFATTQTYVRDGDGWRYLAGQTAPTQTAWVSRDQLKIMQLDVACASTRPDSSVS